MRKRRTGTWGDGDRGRAESVEAERSMVVKFYGVSVIRVMRAQ